MWLCNVDFWQGERNLHPMHFCDVNSLIWGCVWFQSSDSRWFKSMELIPKVDSTVIFLIISIRMTRDPDAFISCATSSDIPQLYFTLQFYSSINRREWCSCLGFFSKSWWWNAVKCYEQTNSYRSYLNQFMRRSSLLLFWPSYEH